MVSVYASSFLFIVMVTAEFIYTKSVSALSPATEVTFQGGQVSIPVSQVADGDLHPVLEQIPQAWRDRLGLLQNELLPRDWQAHQLINPTVISVWFGQSRQNWRARSPSKAPGSALMNNFGMSLAASQAP